MEEIVGQIKQNPKTYISLLNKLLKDKTKLVTGMKNFIYEKAPETQAVCEKYSFSMDTLFTMLSRILEEERWQWQESEVTDATDKLTLDLTLVGVVNEAIDGTAESVEKIKETLSNYLDYISIPGCVYVSMPDAWAHTVSTIHNISLNKWITYSNDEKVEVISELEKYLCDAIENISHPLNVLKLYISKNNLGTFSDEEYNEILAALPKEPFEQTEHNFKTNIINKIKELAYTKKVSETKSLWKEKTGLENVSVWTANNSMPITWVMPHCGSMFSLILALENNERVDESRLYRVLTEIEKTDFSILSNQSEIDKQFVVNVASEKYLSILIPHIKDIKSKIQNRGFKNYSSWSQNLVSIRSIEIRGK
jgi:hypothetical protein